jgi:hypothetical protein
MEWGKKSKKKNKIVVDEGAKKAPESPVGLKRSKSHSKYDEKTGLSKLQQGYKEKRRSLSSNRGLFSMSWK